jgi:hypothetical protein
MSAITSDFIKKHQLSPDMSVEELSKFSLEFNNIPELKDWKVRKNAKSRLLKMKFHQQKKFSHEQVSALLPDRRSNVKDILASDNSVKEAMRICLIENNITSDNVIIIYYRYCKR